MNQREFVTKRAQAHAAGTQDLKNDILVQAAFAKITPMEPMASPMLPGWMTRRQAE